MANVGVSAIKLIDSDGDALDDGSGKLNVNATLVAGDSIDIGDVEIKGHATVKSTSKDIGDSITQLNATIGACKHVDIMSSVANTGIIYIGGSNVTAARGIALYPGDVYSVDVEDTDLLFAIAIVDEETLQIVTYS